MEENDYRRILLGGRRRVRIEQVICWMEEGDNRRMFGGRRSIVSTQLRADRVPLPPLVSSPF